MVDEDKIEIIRRILEQSDEPIPIVKIREVTGFAQSTIIDIINERLSDFVIDKESVIRERVMMVARKRKEDEYATND